MHEIYGPFFKGSDNNNMINWGEMRVDIFSEELTRMVILDYHDTIFKY